MTPTFRSIFNHKEWDFGRSITIHSKISVQIEVEIIHKGSSTTEKEI
jgi:hypothetical protein